MDKEIKKGDSFLCIKNVFMNDDNELAYNSGNTYVSDNDGCITDNQGDKKHFWDGLNGEDTWSGSFIKRAVKEHPTIVFNTNVYDPPHYDTGKFECINVMEGVFGKEALLAFCRLSAFKYLWRAGNKEGSPYEEDLDKARWYEAKAIELINKLKDERCDDTQA